MQCKICGQNNPPEAHFCANCGSSWVAATEQPAPTVVTGAEPATPQIAVEYMGFWIRFGAAIIDGVLVWLVSSVFFFFLFTLNNIGGFPPLSPLSSFWFPLSWLYYWLFTGLKGQTVGKMAFGIKVVDRRGNIPGLGIAALREIPGKILSSIVLYLGFLWIIWGEQKQGWHDKIASTYVVRATPGN